MSSTRKGTEKFRTELAEKYNEQRTKCLEVDKSDDCKTIPQCTPELLGKTINTCDYNPTLEEIWNKYNNGVSEPVPYDSVNIIITKELLCSLDSIAEKLEEEALKSSSAAPVGNSIKKMTTAIQEREIDVLGGSCNSNLYKKMTENLNFVKLVPGKIWTYITANKKSSLALLVVTIFTIYLASPLFATPLLANLGNVTNVTNATNLTNLTNVTNATNLKNLTLNATNAFGDYMSTATLATNATDANSTMNVIKPIVNGTISGVQLVGINATKLFTSMINNISNMCMLNNASALITEALPVTNKYNYMHKYMKYKTKFENLEQELNMKKHTFGRSLNNL